MKDNDGCLMWLFAGVGLLLGLYIMGAGSVPSNTGKAGSTTSTSSTYTQINVLSAVNNGRILSNDTSTSTTQNTASGDRAQISTDSAGNPMCWDNASQQYVYSPCPQVQP